MIVYCATSNSGKLREFRFAAERAGIDLEPLPGLGQIAAPDETGETFEANAIQKALYYGAYCDGMLFAEDSGIEVEALAGAPGVYSARYAGEGASDAANNSLLLERMSGVEDRRARFVCTVALVRAGQVLKTFRGEVQGEILHAERGEQGFGYDPLFYYPYFGCSFGEVPLSHKMRVSHRIRALAAMFAWLGQSTMSG